MSFFLILFICYLIFDEGQIYEPVKWQQWQLLLS